MADEELIQYIKEHKGIYGLTKLKKGLADQGVAEDDIEEALELIEDEESVKAQRIYEEEVELDQKTESKEDLAGFGKRKRIAKEVAVYGRKADTILHALLKALKVPSNDRDFYRAVLASGALVFVMMGIVIALFQFFGARFALSRIVADISIMGTLSVLPDILVLDTSKVALSVVYGAFWGAILNFVFIRYGLKWWPFKMWHQPFKKFFAFYLLIHLFFGIIINGLLVSFKGVFLVGYLIIAIGMALASYMGATFFLQAVEKNHEEKLKEVVRKSW